VASIWRWLSVGATRWWRRTSGCWQRHRSSRAF